MEKIEFSGDIIYGWSLTLMTSLFFFFSVLVAELNERFMRLVYLWDQDPRASRILRQIFEYVSNHEGKHRNVLI